ncbi:MAG: FmdB family transcriptional regulator [Planctomycetes bacterium DG_58]|nr:MAG: FmdB family transcriptional regulator [Planctomycetes bacterium DG_58]
MPTYEYLCEKCGNRFERFQSMSAEPVRRCPQCSGPVRRLISGGAAAIVRNPSAGSTTRCGSARTCCGRDVPCEVPPCND